MQWSLMSSVEDERFQFLLWWSSISLFLLYNSPVFGCHATLPSKRALRDIPKKGCEGDYDNAGKKNCWAISQVLSTLYGASLVSQSLVGSLLGHLLFCPW